MAKKKTVQKESVRREKSAAKKRPTRKTKKKSAAVKRKKTKKKAAAKKRSPIKGSAKSGKKSVKKKTTKKRTAKKRTAKKRTAKKRTAKKKTAKKRTAKKKATKKKTTKKKRATRKKTATKKKSAGKRGSRKSVTNKQTGFYDDMEEMQKDRAANWPALSEQRHHAEQVLEKKREGLFKQEDVTGVHVGLKQTAGKIVRPLEYVICVHVKVKRRKDDPLLTKKNTIKSKIGGVPTDVIEMSYRRSLATASASQLPQNQARHDPIIGGIAISREVNPTDYGTLGMVVFSMGQPMFLTNQHVAGSKGDEIRQPPIGQEPDCVIGTTMFERLDTSVDCALIEPSGSRQHALQILGLDGVSGDAFIEGELDAMDEQVTKVFKIGAKTGFKPLRIGVVQSISASIDIPDQTSFTGQILVSNDTLGFDLIEPGDSGSILLIEEQREMGVIYRVVGLVHAETEGTDNLVASHFRDVRNALGIRLHPVF